MYPRLIAPHLKRLANQYPVITIMGPRQSGKTTLSRAVFADYEYVNLEDLEKRQFAIIDPKGFLNQFKGRGVILDEIQRAPDLPSYIQVRVDEHQYPGQFILTGSQQFSVMDTLHQSLAGRTAIIKLLPLAYEELYNTKPDSISQVLFNGFYPRIHDKHLNAQEALSFYVSTYLERDLKQLMHIKDLYTFEKFLKICALQAGQLLNYSTIANDCGIDQKTVKSWLSLLEASFIIYQVKPHFKNYKKRLVKSSKLYFYDVGLLCYLLGIAKENDVQSHPLRGAIFENFIVTECLKNRFNNIKDDNLFFYRDHTGNEIDLICDEGNRLNVLEIKSGETLHSSFFKSLNAYKENANQEINAFIIYGGNELYVMSDVHIYPYFEITKLFKEINQQ